MHFIAELRSGNFLLNEYCIALYWTLLFPEHGVHNGPTVDPIPDEADEADPVLLVCEVTFFESDAYLFVVDLGEVCTVRQRLARLSGTEPCPSVLLTDIITVAVVSRCDLMVALLTRRTLRRICITNTVCAAAINLSSLLLLPYITVVFFMSLTG